VKRSGFLVPMAALLIGASSAARLRAQGSDADPVRVERVADKLGVKLLPNSARELEIGQSVTAMLDDPTKLASHGIKTMHEGARVTITCVGPGKIRVEADEMEPVSHDEVVLLHVAGDGALTPAPKPTAPAKPPAV